MRRISTLLMLALSGTAVAGKAREGELVRYDFDGNTVETGPYSVMVFEHAKGSVGLTSDYRKSGYRSVEITDVAGDGDFAELQGYFSETAAGKLFVHFALMTAEPGESFNVAVAGPAHFNLERDGIGFWMQNREGWLHHFSGGESLPLFEPRAFTWYTVDVTLDVGSGTYDITIVEEGRDEPRVRLRDQPNATRAPGSKFDRFSFIGDPPGVDRSNARFYVDDVFVGRDSPSPQGPFVAPGRRMLFVDMWDHYEARLYREPRCLSVLHASDFGFSDADLRQLAATGRLELFEALSRSGKGPLPAPADIPDELSRALRAMDLWRTGCAAPPGCKSPCATRLLQAAADLAPEAKLYPMSVVLSLAAEKRWEEADALFLGIYADWQDDPRFPAVSALLGIARGDLGRAESELVSSRESQPAETDDPLIRRLWSGQVDRQLVADLREKFPDAWAGYVETALVAEERYYVLLWQDRFAEARAYADARIRQHEAMAISTSRWRERRGDAAFRAGDYAGALASYEAALVDRSDRTSLLLKLSDVYFKLGNLDLERAYREKIYGTLSPN